MIPKAPADATLVVRNFGLAELQTGEIWCAAFIAPHKYCSLVVENHAEKAAIDRQPAVIIDEAKLLELVQ